jgi:hypothetical protein
MQAILWLGEQRADARAGPTSGAVTAPARSPQERPQLQAPDVPAPQPQDCLYLPVRAGANAQASVPSLYAAGSAVHCSGSSARTTRGNVHAVGHTQLGRVATADDMASYLGRRRRAPPPAGAGQHLGPALSWPACLPAREQQEQLLREAEHGASPVTRPVLAEIAGNAQLSGNHEPAAQQGDASMAERPGQLKRSHAAMSEGDVDVGR